MSMLFPFSGSRSKPSKQVGGSTYSSTIKKEAISSSETSVHFHRPTQRYIPEDSMYFPVFCFAYFVVYTMTLTTSSLYNV
jgi:hypothetical protein